MINELPRSAFHLFIALKAPRSLQVVAQALDVPAELVERVADRERWCQRVDSIERYARLHAQGGRKGPVRRERRRLLELAQQLQRRGLRHLRQYPLLTALECVDRNESEARERRERGEPELGERELCDLNDEIRGLVLADRRQHGTPALDEEWLV